MFAIAAATAVTAVVVRQRVLTSRQFLLKQIYKNPKYRNLDVEVAKLQADVQAAPGSVQPRWKLADMYQKLHLLDLAREQISEITRLAPNDATAAIALADIDLALQHDSRAEQEFRSATVHWPKIVAGWQGLAAVLYREEHYTECLEATGQALHLEPKSKNTRFILASALLQYARQFPSPEMYAPYIRVARKELEDLLASWPDPAEIHYRLGSANSILRDNNKAVEHLSKAVNLQPTRSQFVVALVDAYIASGNRGDAGRAINAAHQHHVSSPVLFDREGQVLQNDTSPTGMVKAISAFKQAVAAEPKSAIFHEHLGSAYVRAGNLDLAKPEFEQAAQLNPERPFPYQQLAAVYTRLGDNTHATAAAKMATRMVFNEQQLRHFEQLSAAYPEDINLHLVIADRYRDLKMRSAARDKYRMVLRIDPSNKHAQTEVDKLSSSSTAAAGS